MPIIRDQDAYDLLTIARVSLLIKEPFFGVLAMNLELIEVDKKTAERMTTAAVDGRRLWYNPEFIKTLTPDELKFLVGHEVLHCVYNHLQRRFDRDPKIYNMAADYIINAVLKEAGFSLPKIVLYEEKYLNWITEDVYDDLIDKNVKPKETFDHHPGDPGYPGDDGDGDGECDGEGGMSEEERRKLEDDWKDNIIQAAQAAGDVPLGIQRLIRELTEPKMDWKQMLQMHLQSCVRTDYTWMRPNKRTFGTGITLPSMDMDDMVEVCIAIDTSGSVSQEMLQDFLSEVKGVMDAFSGFKIHIACFDTEVHNPATFETEDDLMSYELGGGGGTDFMAWWRYAEEQPWIGDVRKCLFFTDGYPFGDWGIDNLVDTLWIIHGSQNEGPFGHTVFYEDHKREKI